MSNETDERFEHRAWGLLRALARVVIILVLVWTAMRAFDWASGVLMDKEARGSGALMAGMYWSLIALYAVLLAIPFVPGIEIGISLMLLRGAEAAPPVYIATVVGLLIAFLVGRYLPERKIARWCAEIRFHRLANMIEGLQDMSRGRRLVLLRNRMPQVLKWLLVDYRYLAIAILLNLPGNAVLGGGGGILMVAGLSKLFETRAMFLTIVLAVLPVPLTVWLFGTTEILRNLW